jgi:hypothetical protein
MNSILLTATNLEDLLSQAQPLIERGSVRVHVERNGRTLTALLFTGGGNVRGGKFRTQFKIDDAVASKAAAVAFFA